MNVIVDCKVSEVSHSAVEVVLATGKTLWIPRKLIHDQSYDNDGYIDSFTIEHWYAVKHNIQYR